MLDIFDREGNPMTMEQWNALLGDPEYKVVQQDTLENGRWVSTVWLGMNMQYGEGPPLIFETMVFPSHGNYSELYCERYATEAQARQGHQAAMALAAVDSWNGYGDD